MIYGCDFHGTSRRQQKQKDRIVVAVAKILCALVKNKRLECEAKSGSALCRKQ